MTSIAHPHALQATLIETPAAAVMAETPALLPHWKVSHPNGAVLVPNTTRPLQDGAAALVARGYASDTSAQVVLWMDEPGRMAFTPMTIAQVLALP